MPNSLWFGINISARLTLFEQIFGMKNCLVFLIRNSSIKFKN